MRSTLRHTGALALATLTVLASAPGAQAQSSRSTAVLNIEGQGLDEERIGTLTSIVRNEAQQLMDYQVVNTTPINLSEVVLLLGCDASNPACLSQAAEQLDARVLIYGSVQREKDYYRLRVEIFDVEKRKVTRRLQRKIRQDEDMVVAFRRELEQFFRKLREEQQQASLSISSNVRGATVSLNGEAVGTTPLEGFRVAPGEYTIEVTKQGFSTWEVQMTLGERAEMTLRAPLQRQRQPEPEPTGPLPDPDASPRKTQDTVVEIDPPPRNEVNWGGWSLVTIGGVALAGSGVMALLMNGVEQEMRQKFDEGTLTPGERDQLQDRGENYELSHRLLLGVGAAGVVAGGLWLLLDDGSSGDEEAARPRLELRAGPTGVSGTMRF